MPKGNKQQDRLKTAGVLIVSLLISTIAFNAVFAVGVAMLFFVEHTSSMITTIVLIIFAAAALTFGILTFRKIKGYFEKEIRET